MEYFLCFCKLENCRELCCAAAQRSPGRRAVTEDENGFTGHSLVPVWLAPQFSLNCHFKKHTNLFGHHVSSPTGLKLYTSNVSISETIFSWVFQYDDTKLESVSKIQFCYCESMSWWETFISVVFYSIFRCDIQWRNETKNTGFKTLLQS